MGGLYGLALGQAFFGESMFARATDASKIAFATFAQQLHTWGFQLIDCQVVTDHLLRFGAREFALQAFLQRLDVAVDAPSKPGPWVFDAPAGSVPR